MKIKYDPLQRKKPDSDWLLQEAALVKEIEDLIDRTIVQIEEQQERNKAVKARMEDDWSDKKQSYNIEAINTNLTIKSPTILFKPGATRFPDRYLWFWSNNTVLHVNMLFNRLLEGARAKR